MTATAKQKQATELEAQLLRLNALVRERREQLARLENCPNKDCPCRLVWREQVETNLAGQVGKIRRQVQGQAAQNAKPPATRRRKSGNRRSPPLRADGRGQRSRP